tara:strand:- start:991 stop:1755 length:765 start_codon:yes stop_codon:yes gene_type:complete
MISFNPQSNRAISRSATLVLAALIILGLGLVIRQLPGDWTLTTAEKAMKDLPNIQVDNVPPESSQAPLFDSREWRLQTRVDDRGQARAVSLDTPRQQQVRVLFEHGANLIRQGAFSQARSVLEMLLRLAPRLPEAYVNLGFVLYEQGEIASSIHAFSYASQLNPYQSNAYYGAALGYERQADYEAAIGHMRSFIHLSQADNAFLPKARAALWEWDQVIESQRLTKASAAVLSVEEKSSSIKPSVVSEAVPNAQK